MFNKAIFKEYAFASLVTFIVAFATALQALDTSHVDQAALFGILSVAAREGFRAVFNLLLTKFTTISSRPQ